ncbi:MAG: alpha/beta hydrolase [Alphaproteobacteria bacterium]|nr:alpha/beta hydrolase [Alphaproteobacteria bacterium]
MAERSFRGYLFGTVKWLVVAGFAAYLLLVAALYLNQRDLMYHPDRRVPDLAAAGLADMTVHRIETSDGYRLLAWWKPPADSSRPTIVFFHGNAGNVGNRKRQARQFIDAGLGLLLVTWRYNAGAGGEASEEGLLTDGRAALGFVGAQGIPERRIVLHGESLGSGVAVAMALEHEVGGLVLVYPYSSMTDVAEDRFWFAPVRMLIQDEFDSVARIGKVRAPILMIHGERDRIIPVRFARRLYEAAPEPKEGHFLPEGNHANLYRLGAGQLVLDFLERRVVVAPTTMTGG